MRERSVGSQNGSTGFRYQPKTRGTIGKYGNDAERVSEKSQGSARSVHS